MGLILILAREVLRQMRYANNNDPTRRDNCSSPNPVSGVFTSSTYIIQTRISESFRSVHEKNQLGIRYQVSTFEIKDTSGALVAVARHMINDKSPAPVSLLANLTSLASPLRTYSLETPQGVRLGELHGSGGLIPNSPYLEIKDANGKTIATITMRVTRKTGSFFSPGITTWTLESSDGQELAEIKWGKG